MHRGPQRIDAYTAVPAHPMNEEKKHRFTATIADLEPFVFSISASEEPIFRRAAFHVNELIKKTRELEGYKRQLETAKANPNANSSYIAQLNNQITTLETNIKSLKTAINASGQSVDPTFNIDTYKQYSDY